jgi:hypothetical protein
LRGKAKREAGDRRGLKADHVALAPSTAHPVLCIACRKVQIVSRLTRGKKRCLWRDMRQGRDLPERGLLVVLQPEDVVGEIFVLMAGVAA